jgi:hypothetical protein
MNNNNFDQTPSITKQPLYRAQVKNKEITMEQLRTVSIAVFDALEKEGIHFVSHEQEDKFHASLNLFLEESFNWPDYVSFN